MPHCGLLLEQPRHGVLDRRRDIASIRRGKYSVLVKNRVRNRDMLVPTERLSPRQHLEKHDTEGPQVRTSVGVPAPDLLRRHVGHGPETNAGLAHTLIARFSQSKIED